MKFPEKLKKIYDTTEDQRYVYVSDNPERLDYISNEILALVDFDKASTVIYIVLPLGIPHLQGAFDGVFIDSNTDLNGYPTIPLKPEGKSYVVDEETNEVSVAHEEDLLH